MLRTCKVCGKVKDETEFPIHSEGRRRSTCKECWNVRNRSLRAQNADKYRERWKNYYQEHKEEVMARTKAWSANHKDKRREIVRDMRKRWRTALQSIKSTEGCLLCGETDPPALDFHHLDMRTKELNISQGVISPDKLEKELEKCVVLCANCHRKVHYYGYKKFPKLMELMKDRGLANLFEE